MINKLPEHEPNENLWLGIQNKLNQKSTLGNLPTYEPEAAVWNNLNSKLNQNSNRPKLIWFGAASIFMFISFYFFFANNQNRYTQQKIEQEPLISIKTKNEKNIQNIQRICETDKLVCDKPIFKTLKSELENLNSASEELKNAIGNFNSEPELLEQLAVIENQKSDIIKKMEEQI
jgi:hypothetical protein